MMGRLKSDQGQLFYEFHLNDAVPEDHLVRKIDAVLDLSWLRSELAPHYSSMGRPSIDPELMIRMLVVGYVFAIRSERLICREVQVNLAYRWFCKLGIEDAIPDHSAFSRARNERFRDGDVIRRVFERIVETCIAAGLVGGEGFAVDASLIAADANKQRSIAGQDWRRDRDPARSSRAVKEYLATLDDTAWGAASDVVPKFVSPSDPAAQWTGAHKGPAFFAYSDNYLIDVKFGVIVDVEASRSIRQAEVGAAKTMIERTEERFGLKPERLETRADHLIFIDFDFANLEGEVIFNGPERIALQNMPATWQGQRPVSAVQIRLLNRQVAPADRLAVIDPTPQGDALSVP
jgi:transposase